MAIYIPRQESPYSGAIQGFNVGFGNLLQSLLQVKQIQRQREDQGILAQVLEQVQNDPSKAGQYLSEGYSRMRTAEGKSQMMGMAAPYMKPGELVRVGEAEKIVRVKPTGEATTVAEGPPKTLTGKEPKIKLYHPKTKRTVEVPQSSVPGMLKNGWEYGEPTEKPGRVTMMKGGKKVTVSEGQVPAMKKKGWELGEPISPPKAPEVMGEKDVAAEHKKWADLQGKLEMGGLDNPYLVMAINMDPTGQLAQLYKTQDLSAIKAYVKEQRDYWAGRQTEYEIKRQFPGAHKDQYGRWVYKYKGKQYEIRLKKPKRAEEKERF